MKHVYLLGIPRNSQQLKRLICHEAPSILGRVHPPTAYHQLIPSIQQPPVVVVGKSSGWAKAMASDSYEVRQCLGCLGFQSTLVTSTRCPFPKKTWMRSKHRVEEKKAVGLVAEFLADDPSISIDPIDCPKYQKKGVLTWVGLGFSSFNGFLLLNFCCSPRKMVGKMMIYFC